MDRVSQCCLCSQIAGDRENDLIATLLGAEPYVRRIAFESIHFAALPSLGPLTEGHFLLCTKAHYKSFACIPTTLDKEFLETKRNLSAVLLSEFGPPVHIFEHGAPRQGPKVLCTVDHAHLHLVPAAVDVWPLLQAAGIDWRALGATRGDLRNRVADREYLYYESPEGRAVVATSKGEGFESQLLRRVFARALGKSHDWDWRSDPRPANADAAFERVRTSFPATRDD